jgi:hypothetical protein
MLHKIMSPRLWPDRLQGRSPGATTDYIPPADLQLLWFSLYASSGLFPQAEDRKQARRRQNVCQKYALFC